MQRRSFTSAFFVSLQLLFWVSSLLWTVQSHEGHEHEDHSNVIEAQNWTHFADLKKTVGVDLKWMVDEDDSGDWVTMEMSSKTMGYVAVGFCEQWRGTMEGCDIVIGGVDDMTGKGYLYDCHAKENGNPIIDVTTNYELVSATQKSWLTTVVFKRRWNTNDTEDANLENQVQLIWSWNPRDVTNTTSVQIPPHDKNTRGHTTTKVSLKSPPPENTISNQGSSAGYLGPSLFLTISISVYLQYFYGF